MSKLSFKRKKHGVRKFFTVTLMIIIIFTGVITGLIMSGKLDRFLVNTSSNKNNGPDDKTNPSDPNKPNNSGLPSPDDNIIKASVMIGNNSESETDGLIDVSSAFILKSDKELNEPLIKSYLQISPETEYTVSTADSKTFEIKPLKPLDGGKIYRLRFNPPEDKTGLSWAFQTRGENTGIFQDETPAPDASQPDYIISARADKMAVIIGDNINIKAESMYYRGFHIPYQNLTADNGYSKNTLTTDDAGIAEYSFNTYFLNNKLNEGSQYVVASVKISPSALNKKNDFGEAVYCAFASSIFFTDCKSSYNSENKTFEVSGSLYNLDLDSANGKPELMNDNIFGPPKANHRVSAALTKFILNESGEASGFPAGTFNLVTDANGRFYYGAEFDGGADYYELTVTAYDSGNRKTSQAIMIRDHDLLQNTFSKFEGPPSERGFYIEAACNSEFFEGDAPIVILRSYGGSLARNVNVDYKAVLTAPDGSEKEYNLNARSFKSAEIELPELLYGEYNLNVSAVCGGFSDGIIKKLNVTLPGLEQRSSELFRLTEQWRNDGTSPAGRSAYIITDYNNSEKLKLLLDSVYESGREVYELWALASAGEAVLGRVNQYLRRGGLIPEEKILLTLGLIDLGAEKQAFEIYTQMKTEGFISTDSPAGILEQRLENLNAEKIPLSYELNGKKFSKSLAPGEYFIIKQPVGLRFYEIQSELGLISEIFEPLSYGPAGNAGTLSISRRYSQIAAGTTNDLSKKALVTVTVNISVNGVQEGVCTVTDVLPAGLRFGGYDGPGSVACRTDGREVSFTFDAADSPSRIVYTARVVSGGRYFAPAPVIRHSVDNARAAGIGTAISLS